MDISEFKNKNIYEIYLKLDSLTDKKENDRRKTIMELGPDFFNELNIRTTAFLHIIDDNNDKLVAEKMCHLFNNFLLSIQNIYILKTDKTIFEIKKLEKEWQQYAENMRNIETDTNEYGPQEFLNYNDVMRNIANSVNCNNETNLKDFVNYEIHIQIPQRNVLESAGEMAETFFTVNNDNSAINFVLKKEAMKMLDKKLQQKLLSSDKEGASSIKAQFVQPDYLPLMEYRKKLSNFWKIFRETQKSSCVVISDARSLINLSNLQKPNFIPMILKKESKCYVLKFVRKNDFFEDALREWARCQENIKKEMETIELTMNKKELFYENVVIEFDPFLDHLNQLRLSQIDYFDFHKWEKYFSFQNKDFPYLNEIKSKLEILRHYYNTITIPKSNFECYQCHTNLIPTSTKSISIFYSTRIFEPKDFTMAECDSPFTSKEEWLEIQKTLPAVIEKYEELKDDDITLKISKDYNGSIKYQGEYINHF